MDNPIMLLAQKLGVPYAAGDQDLYLLRASGGRCLEFALASERLELTGIQQAELLGLVLASYERYLEDNPRNTTIEDKLQQMYARWRAEPWVEQMLRAEGWRDEGPFGEAIAKLRSL